METIKPVAIIGGGIAGLTAASFLKKNNIPFVLYEAGKKLAGLAASFKDDDGFSYDFGAHFITNRLADAIGISEECRLVKHYGEAVWIDNRSYTYPLGLVKIPRLTLSFIQDKIKNIGRKNAPASAAEWFSKRYGTALSKEVALPLLEAWSGAPATELSPALGEGLFGGGIAKALYLKLAAILSGKAVACGYNTEKPETPKVWHVYPKGGLSTLCDKLAQGLEDSIKLQSPVESILVENGKVTAIRVNGEIKEVAAVISTAPANILSKLVEGTDVLDFTSRFRYRPMVFVNVRLKGRNLLPDTVLWLPEKKFPFFRLTEAVISMPWLAPEGKTIITIDIGCEKSDDVWSMDENKLTELCMDSLQKIIPDVKERFLGSNVLRTPISYPVFLNAYEDERKKFGQSTNIENLLSVGRNGEFSHMFMEDVYWRTQKKVAALIEKLYAKKKLRAFKIKKEEEKVA